MTTTQLLTMAAYTLAGAYLSGRMEAKEIAQGNKIPHFLLTLLRISGGLLVIGATMTAWVTLPEGVMMLVMMAGVFGPVHRITLNLTRINKYGQRIPWFRLGDGFYDSITVFIADRPTRFVALCAFEALVAVAMFVQLLHN